MSGSQVYIAGAVLLGVMALAGGGAPQPGGPTPGAPTPTPDRLATPVMPESPTQVDIGRELYYYHCMPCHGDRGQGLTDEWREAWEDDHQNCWARGCHTGRAGEEGFYLPRAVPPVSGPAGALGHFQTAEGLFSFLRATQPPNRPGDLTDEEYWALTAFLLHEVGRLPADAQLGGPASCSPGPSGGLGPAAALVLSVGVLLALWAARPRKTRAS
jgi:mono/diheme cytochrome c family protein